MWHSALTANVTVRFIPRSVSPWAQGDRPSPFPATLELDPVRPELSVALQGEGDLPASIGFPLPFASKRGDYVVLPMNEGISYPVDDQTVEPMRLIAYGGHGICMSFWGCTDGTSGQMAILETGDDAAVRVDRVVQLLSVSPEWEPQKGQFGYERRVRCVFLPTPKGKSIP